MATRIRIPSSKWARAMHRATNRYRKVKGGRYSGKSVEVSNDTMVEMLTLPELRVMYCRNTQNSIDRSSFDLLKQSIRNAGLMDEFDIGAKEIVAKETDSVAFFAGLGRSLEAVKSIPDLDRTIVEEGQYVAPEAYELLLPTVRDRPLTGRKSRITIIWNPRYTDDAVTKIDMDEELDAWDSGTLTYRDMDSRFYTDSLWEEIERVKREEPDLYDHIYEGAFRPYTERQIFPRAAVDDAFRTLPAPKPVGLLGAGVDIAWTEDPKTSDYNTVLELDEEGNYFGAIRFMTADHSERCDKIIDFLLTPPVVDEVLYDATGGGNVMQSAFDAEEIPARGIAWNTGNKREMASLLNTYLTDYRLALGRSDDLLGDIFKKEFYEYVESESGKLGARIGHDDLVSGAMLAVRLIHGWQV